MADTNINIRTNSELKAKAQSVLADLGLDMSTAINMYLNQIVYRQAIPFDISKMPSTAVEKELEAKKVLQDLVATSDTYSIFTRPAVNESNESDDNKSQRQLAALERLVAANTAITDEPFDDEFDAILADRLNITREMAI